MNDISKREDIEFLVKAFYEKATVDELIGYIFTDIMQLDFEVHIPHICDFWESVLLGNMVYRGNPMLKHIALHQKEKLTNQHFERWISIWESTVNEHFEGGVADDSIKRAQLMGDLMQFKIKQSEQEGFIQ